jgi:hypothetical protein
VNRAAALGAAQPAEPEQAAGERAPDRTREVVCLLAPVDAVAQRQPLRTDIRQLDPEACEPLPAAGRQPVVDVAARRRQPVVAVAVEPVATVTADDRLVADERLQQATPSRPARWS